MVDKYFSYWYMSIATARHFAIPEMTFVRKISKVILSQTADAMARGSYNGARSPLSASFSLLFNITHQK
jgi:hypothetical protein